MISLTADEKMAALLSQAGGLAEIRDPRGNVLGFFAPIAYENAQHDASAAAPIDSKDSECIKQIEEECYSYEVVRDRLRLLQVEVQRREAAGEPAMTADNVVEFLDLLRGSDLTTTNRAG
jgi:hypothetical protein